MLSYLVDMGRVGQYLRVGERAREALIGPREDLRFLAQVRRGLLPLPFDRPAQADPFPPAAPNPNPGPAGRKVAVVATGGSGALASVVGVVRALEEAGASPAGYGVCSGSAFFGIPLAAGIPPDELAHTLTGLRPSDYLDPDWFALARAPLTLGRGWDGLVRGDALEATMRRIIGDVTLGQLATPVWFPMWNIEANRLEYFGSASHPDLPAAAAVRMAVSLPIAVQPVRFEDGWWMDGGIVDILPAAPFLVPGAWDVAVVVNGFYGEGFEPDHEPHWRDSVLSILRVASQTRLMHHVELTRRAIADLRRVVPDVIELTPVDYSRVHGAGLYGEFLDNRSWPDHMRAGYDSASAALARWSSSRPSGSPP
ncbi:MAG TPA: patatin-like phospholipase family protein [Candidatus Nanopelagicales bacterium]